MVFDDNNLGFAVFRLVAAPFLVLGAPPSPSLINTFIIQHFLLILLATLKSNRKQWLRFQWASFGPFFADSLLISLGLTDVSSLKIVVIGF